MKAPATLAGTLVAAFLASVCCLGPLVLGVLCIGSLGLAATIAPFRPWLLGLTGLLLAIAFYLAYRPEATAECGPDGECPAPASRRTQRISLWVVTVLTLLMATYPRWSSLGMATDGARTLTSKRDAISQVVTLDIHGMTCADCEGYIERELKRLPGVVRASVSYATQSGLVELGRPINLRDVSAAVERAGYRATNVHLATTIHSNSSRPDSREGLTGATVSGQWKGRLAVGEDQTSELVVDLGEIGNRWVGEFDLIDFDVRDYPVHVLLDGRLVRLNLTAAQIDFAGSLSASGDTVRGIATTRGNRDTLVLVRVGEPRFSPDFLALEAAAEDSTRVASLSADAAELRRQFNADRAYTRLLMLLSPT